MMEENNATNETCFEDNGLVEITYIVTYLFIYAAGLFACSVVYVLKWLIVKKLKKVDSKKNKLLHYSANLRNSIRQLISGDTIPSKILISVTLTCNLIFMGLSIYRSIPPFTVRECFKLSSTPSHIVELVVVIELLLFSLLRFLATNNKVLFWFSLYTIVDVVTLPHIFISLALGVDWIGFRSLRFVWLTQIVTVIRFIPYIVTSQDTVDILNLTVYVMVLWLTCSGIIHLLESQGDPWKNFDNRVEDRSVLLYIYYIMVTLSTVGYGDINPLTDLGRTFMTFFIIGGLAFFAAILPQLVDVVLNYYAKTQYAKFDTTRVPRHVIVCGHITAVTAEDFLKDFLHPDRGDNHTHILFLHPEKPDQDLKNVLRSYYTRVQFLLGSVMNSNDLQRAKISSSTAIFILANKYTNYPTREDSANLLRLVSIKNTTDEITVIIQLLHSFSKKQVYSIEGWKVGRDIAICLNELKLGILAQNCLCPGFSTLISNLFYTSDFTVSTSVPGEIDWKDNYVLGASNEIYSSVFSPAFKGKTYHETAKICYNELNLVLLVIEQFGQKKLQYYFNPSPSSHPNFMVNHESMIGYFIAQDKDHVLAVSTYSEDEFEFNITRKHRENIRALRRKVTLSKPRDHTQALKENYRLTENETAINFESSINASKDEVDGYDTDYASDSDEVEDQELYLYESEPNKLEKSILNPDITELEYDLWPKPDIQDHIVMCIFADKKSPLLGLHNFLKPLRQKNLPLESIKPVVIVSDKAFIEKEWVIIRNIPKVHIVVGSPLRWQNLKVAKILDCSMCIILSVLGTAGREQAINDKEAILCSLSIQKQLKKRAKKEIQVLTDLRQESNVQFLDFLDEDEPDERIYKSQPFACGEAFSVTMFDSLTTSSFHNPGITYLIEDLIHASATRSPCHISQMQLFGSGFVGKTFKEYFNDHLEKYNACLGLFRRHPTRKDKRYLITTPSPDLVLKEDDIALVLCP